MQIKTFILPVTSDNGELDDFNRFLRSVRILELKKELVRIDSGTFWAVCVTYMAAVGSAPGQSVQNAKCRVDYKDLLSEADFERFCNLRKIRKRIADDAAIPAFAVFSDAELAEISKIEQLTLTSLKGVRGIGEKKIEKYGAEFCNAVACLEKSSDETDRSTV